MSLTLLVLGPKLVLLLTDVLFELSLFLLFYTSAIPKVTWYEPINRLRIEIRQALVLSQIVERIKRNI